MVQSPQASFVDRLRQPEYTGENRCMPCTVTNIAIAVAVSAVVGYAGLLFELGLAVAVGVGAGLFVVSLAAIYLRGYLVPGTPTLTKRYFPEWFLDLFGKAETDKHDPIETDVDVESILMESRVIEPKPHGDLGLTDEFEAVLFEQIETERANDTDREALADIVGIDAESLSFESYSDGAFVAFRDNARVGSWESRAAFLADAAAGRLLPDYYEDWDETTPAERGAILGGLRLFLERCPACDGPVRFGQEVVESCCRTHDVVAITCEACDSRLFEVEVTEEMLEPEQSAV